MIQVNPPELLARYASERKALVMAMLTHNAIAAAIAGLFAHSEQRWPLLVIPTVWALVWTILPLRRIAQIEREQKLAGQSRATGFTVSDGGLSCNIALLRGQAGNRLRKENKGIFHSGWEQITSFKAVAERVIRSHEPQYRRMKHVTEGQYVLTLADGSQARIARTLLMGHEADIINFIRTNTKVPVEIDGKLG